MGIDWEAYEAAEKRYDMLKTKKISVEGTALEWLDVLHVYKQGNRVFAERLESEGHAKPMDDGGVQIDTNALHPRDKRWLCALKASQRLSQAIDQALSSVMDAKHRF